MLSWQREMTAQRPVLSIFSDISISPYPKQKYNIFFLTPNFLHNHLELATFACSDSCVTNILLPWAKILLLTSHTLKLNSIE